jgi:vesicle-fusing ATPase
MCPAGVMDRQLIVFTIRQSPEVKPGTIGLSLTQRKFATASIGQDMDVYPYEFDRATSCCASILLEVDFLQKKQ